MSATGTKYDGDFAQARQDGPAIPFQDNETRSTLYQVNMVQLAAKWQRAEMGLKGPNGSVLVEESMPAGDIAGVVKWQRTFAEVPRSRSEPEETIYGYQGINGTTIYELPIGVTARVVYDYFHTRTPEKIHLAETYTLIQVGTVILYLGTKPKAGATEILAENDQLSRWKGNIWVRKRVLVPAFSASLLP